MTSRTILWLAWSSVVLLACGETLGAADDNETIDAGADATIDATVDTAAPSDAASDAAPDPPDADSGLPPYVKPSCYVDAATAATVQVTPNAPEAGKPVDFVVQAQTAHVYVQFRICVGDGGLSSVGDGPVDSNGPPYKWFYDSPGLAPGWVQAQFRTDVTTTPVLRGTLDFYVAP